MPRRRTYETDADRQRAYRRRRKAARLNVHFQSLLDVRATPLDLFDALHREFGFETDVCAMAYNAKCARYFTPEVNGLAQEWRGVCFMNPPYGREMGAWLKKALESARAGATVVCVLPSRTDALWWHEYVMRATEVRFVRGRVTFGGSENPAPFPTAVAVFQPGDEAGRCVSWTYERASRTTDAILDGGDTVKSSTEAQKFAYQADLITSKLYDHSDHAVSLDKNERTQI